MAQELTTTTVTCAAPDDHTHGATEFGECDAWRCLCGNEGYLDGFYVCDADGNEREPVGLAELYIFCARCDRLLTTEGVFIGMRKEGATRLD